MSNVLEEWQIGSQKLEINKCVQTETGGGVKTASSDVLVCTKGNNRQNCNCYNTWFENMSNIAETPQIEGQKLEKSNCVQTEQGGGVTTASDVLLCINGNNGKNCNCCNIWFKLSDDLLVEIFCRLPDKHLIRLKCVCKSWNSLISDVCVPKISASSPLCGFIYHAMRIDSEPFIDYVPHPPQRGVAKTPGFVQSYSSLLPFEHTPKNFLDCCNGLLLFVGDSVPQYYVCNPLTKQCVAIPRDFKHDAIPTYAALAFDPSKSLHYKVVRFDYSLSRPLGLVIFSSDTGNWAAHSTPLELSFEGHKWIRRCIYLDGVLYRLSYSKHLLRFDLIEVNARAIELPEKERTDHLGFIGLSRGRLYYSNRVGSGFFIWLLEDSCKVDRWILMHTIGFDDLDEHPLGSAFCLFSTSSFFKPYALHPTSEFIFLGSIPMMVSYHLEDKRLALACRMQRDRGILSGECRVFPYTECLVSLKDFSEMH